MNEKAVEYVEEFGAVPSHIKKSKVAFDLGVLPLRYSIGDVSRVLGMTTSALHFYEKEGIINTPKQESGRRYYQQADINRLISAKKYRAMDVSVREIAQQFGHDGMTGSQVDRKSVV